MVHWLFSLADPGRDSGAALWLPELSAEPASVAAGQTAHIGGRCCVHGLGVRWRRGGGESVEGA